MKLKFLMLKVLQNESKRSLKSTKSHPKIKERARAWKKLKSSRLIFISEKATVVNQDQ